MYKFVENKDKTWSGIGLTEEAGKYQGVVYEYGKVSIIENEEKTEASLQFDFNVLDSNGLPKEMFDVKFETYDLVEDKLHPGIESHKRYAGKIKDVLQDRFK